MNYTFPSITDLAQGNINVMKKLTARALRRALIEAFLDAYPIACKRSNIRKGFASTGISPYRPDAPLLTPTYPFSKRRQRFRRTLVVST